MLNLKQDKMEQIIQQAFDRASGNRRWETAIVKAKRMIEENPYMTFDDETLLVLSESNEIYEANGACQCKAYRSNQPCKHRAAPRLLKRYFETAH